MNIEKEKKFKVKYIPKKDIYRKIIIEQEYLYFDEITAIRKRKLISGNNVEYLYTVKTKGSCKENENYEIENEITENRFNCLHGYGKIVKERCLVKLKENLVAEIDIFHDKLEGLVYCEIEYDSDKLDVSDIPWIGCEIDSKDFSNSKLAGLNNEECIKIINKLNSKDY